MRRLTLLLLTLPAAALADERAGAADRAGGGLLRVAAIGLVLALGVVQWLVMRR